MLKNHLLDLCEHVSYKAKRYSYFDRADPKHLGIGPCFVELELILGILVESLGCIHNLLINSEILGSSCCRMMYCITSLILWLRNRMTNEK